MYAKLMNVRFVLSQLKELEKTRFVNLKGARMMKMQKDETKMQMKDD